MIAKEYAKTLASVAVLYSLGAAAGASIELDPRSTDFGKIKFGNTRIDPLAGLQQVMRLGSQLITGWRKTAKGQIVPLRDKWRMWPFDSTHKVGYGDVGMGTTVFNFLRSKAAPLPSNLLSAAIGKDPSGQEYKIGTALGQSFSPITYWDIANVMMEQGVPKGAAMSIATIFGMGMQTYDASQRQYQSRGLQPPRPPRP